MRTIKFRVWDTKNKCFIDYNSHKNGALLFDNSIAMSTGWDNEDNPTWDWSKIELDRYAYQQFTGLLDKNGKEIYEGDIIKGGVRTMQVIFKQEACQFWLIWQDSKGVNCYEPLNATYGDDTDYFSNDSLVVVGNIYENPKLLNQ